MKNILGVLLAGIWLLTGGSADQCTTTKGAYRIQEVAATGGAAGATSAWDSNTVNGFYNPNDNVHDRYFHSGPKGGPPTPLPVMVWYDYKEKTIRPAEVSFLSGQSTNLQRGPTSYQFVGSNDSVCNDSAQWTVLCEDRSNTAWNSYEDVKYCPAHPEIKDKFRCLGLRVLNNRQGDGWVTIRNIRIWQRIEKKCECEDD